MLRLRGVLFGDVELHSTLSALSATKPGFEPEPPGGKPATNLLSYGAATK
jgi:hypothetical protein